MATQSEKEKIATELRKLSYKRYVDVEDVMNAFGTWVEDGKVPGDSVLYISQLVYDGNQQDGFF